MVYLIVFTILLSFLVQPVLGSNECTTVYETTTITEVKKAANVNAETLTILQPYERISVIEEKDPYYKVITKKGTTGYVRKIDLQKSSICPLEDLDAGYTPTNKSSKDIVTIPEVTLPEGEISGSIQTVYPEMTTAIKMSSVDINRVVCNEDIKDVVFSEEKGLMVKVSGRYAFIKFQAKKEKNKVQYSKVPADLYIVCSGEVYSIIAIPEQRPAMNIYLSSPKNKVKQTLQRYEGLPLEKKILEIVKSIYTNKIDDSYLWTENREKIKKIYEPLDITMKGYYDIEGEGMRVKLYLVTTNTPVTLTESKFLLPEISNAPLAIALDKLKLSKGDTATLIVIERRRHE